MKLSDVIRPGDKIDIRLARRVIREEGGGDPAPLYQSRVCDQTSDTDVEIEMPISGGKIILLPVGAECHFIFYTKAGMYKCEGVVTKRYKEGNLYFLTVHMTKAPVKFQRREFFRIHYVMPMQFYEITQEIADMETPQEMMKALNEAGEEQKPHKGVTQDISGGGIRFSSEVMLEQGKLVLVEIHLQNEQMDELLYLVSQVVAVQEHELMKKTYIQRVKFLFKDLKIREKIVHFVFEEERKLRRKEMG